MSDKGDKKRRRRGAFARPSDPLGMAPLPLTGPPPVKMPPPRVRPSLDEPVAEEVIKPLLQRSLETALGDRIDERTGDLSYLNDLGDPDDEDHEDFDLDATLTADEDVEDNATEPPPLSIRTTIATARASAAVARVKTARVPTGNTGDLANLVEVNRPTEGLYSNERPDQDEVSVFDSESDDSLFDLVARSNDQENAEDPPSDVVEFGPLPTSPKLVVRDRVQPENFTERTEEDAMVFRDDKQATQKSLPPPHAWWERSTPGGPAPTDRPVAGTRKTWRTPGELDLRRSVGRGRSNRLKSILVLVLVLALCSLAAFAFLKPPSAVIQRDADPMHPAEAELLEQVGAEEGHGPELDQEAPEELEPVEPVEEPPPVEPEVEFEVETDPIGPIGPEVEPEGVVQATNELEDEARSALYDMGLLVVTSNSRALIFVDGTRIGHTPIQGLELEPGTHRVKAVVPGRPPKYQSVRVDPGGAHQLPFSF